MKNVLIISAAAIFIVLCATPSPADAKTFLSRPRPSPQGRRHQSAVGAGREQQLPLRRQSVPANGAGREQQLPLRRQSVPANGAGREQQLPLRRQSVPAKGAGGPSRTVPYKNAKIATWRFRPHDVRRWFPNFGRKIKG